MPADIEWKKLGQKGDLPTARSGHTLTKFGQFNYLLYGGIENNANGKIQPNGDLYIMKMGPNDVNWIKEEAIGDEKPLARTQHAAIATPDNRVFIFGGHHTPQTRLNDTWFLNCKDFEWHRVGKDPDNLNNANSSIGAPEPRANMGSCYYNGKIYIFGGHGGVSYERKSYNDLYCFDVETETWEKLVPNNSPPDGRGGLSLFASDNNIYIYGGWNQEMQFSDIQYFNLATKEWTNPDIFNEVPRWNHSGVLVEAIPTWKFFIFGGEQAEYNEGSARAFGEYVNTSCFLDLGTMRWTKYASDPDVYDDIPKPREYCAMTYTGLMQAESKDRRLIIYGGWNNGWFDDLYSLNVAKIVGPSYAIISSDPTCGQLTGNNVLTITGKGIRDNPRVFFTLGNQPVDQPSRQTQEAAGEMVSTTELTCVTPSFEQFGPKECVIQIAMQGDDLTTTSIPFTYYLNTRAHKSLAYGPGLLQDVKQGEPVEFMIVAKNDLGENRTSGRDNFQVKIVKEVPANPDEEDAKPTKIEIPCEIQDKDDGFYYCKYQCDHEGEVSIDIQFLNDKEEYVPIRGVPFKASFTPGAASKDNLLTGSAMDKHIKKELERLSTLMGDSKKELNTKDKDLKDVKALLKVKENVEQTHQDTDLITLNIDQLDEGLKLFQLHKLSKDAQLKQLNGINKSWVDVKKMVKETKKEIAPLVNQENDKNSFNIKKLEEDITLFIQEMRKREFFQYKCGATVALEKLGGVFGELKVFEDKIDDYGFNAAKFGNPEQINKAERDIDQIKVTVENMKALWDHINTCQNTFEGFYQNKWVETQPFEMEDEVKKLMKTLKDMKIDKKANAYQGILDEIKKWLVFLPLIAELADESMRERHWDMIKAKLGVQFTIDENLLLRDIYNLNIGKYQEDIEEITDQARQEAKMEKTLAKLDGTWNDIEFEFSPHKDSGVQMIRLNEDNFDLLENDQQSVNGMFASRYLATFEDRITFWNKALGAIGEIVILVGEVQRQWSFLENLFIHSDEVKKELPKESEKFIGIDKEVRKILKDGFERKKCVAYCTQDWVLPGLENVQTDLTICEKALNEFMQSKRIAFPRFFFVAQTDLLDILSNGNAPEKVMKHMPKIISAMDTLELIKEGVRPFVKGLHSCVGKEYVEFTRELKLLGKVECYMQDILDCMRGSLADIAKRSIKKFQEIDKFEWICQEPSMTCLLINNCNWVISCESTYTKIQGGQKDAMAACYQKQIDDLNGLIMMVQGDLTKAVRTKIMCMITMDAHSRDIIELLKIQGVSRVDEFQWQVQLKGLYDSGQDSFLFKIADARLAYGYEYLGNGGRLVITPLTDRIYVTATQALHLMMGCAPAGPAGTGKTESTKDLANALGKACYVFNCSDQMDYQGMAGIFMGLAASGSWGCFDEFNRLVPEVLSVCSVQFKAVCDGIKERKTRCTIQEQEVSLDWTCGAYITMNPGYLGRSELPEGLKALFRPITVVVPDLEMIMDNMLMSEGFTQAKALAKKFFTLYSLCKDLLSKAAHYDWGLRAIKSVLVVAGSMKRAEPTLEEPAVLLRALRDFNIPKIVQDDTPIFFGLLGDLFPGIDVPRKRDMDFESVVEAVAKESGMYPDPEFILKIVQLGELLAIRHCVFTMGPPAAGKSTTWRMLAKANDKNNNKTTWCDLNPKVTSTNELYGVVLLATREWKDGLMSCTMRRLAQIEDDLPKWIILDGDLDANWIESMNSVMDDNKLLTLASNERITLKPSMRLIFEIRDLRFATPATVSRAGILYISDTAGTQWRSFVKSWINSMKYDQQMKTDLQKLFDKYIPDTLFHCAKSFKHIIPQVQMSMVMSICKLLQNIFDHHEVKGLEYVFVFATIWCIGGGFGEKEGKDYAKEFSNWWKSEYKVVRFPGKGTVFDYFVDIENSTLEDWNKMTATDIISTIDTSKSIPSYTIPTVNTISFSYLMKQMIQINWCPQLVGLAGCGKTQIIKGLLNELVGTGDEYMQQIINFNFYTDANLLQMVLEQFLEKKASINYAPVGKYKMLYFVDDMNMPARDPYDTQNAIALLRQHRDYGHWYDKNKLTLKNIKNTQLIGAMNPTAGSFFINPRLQRHFFMLAVSFPEQSSLNIIYQAYLNKHFSKFKGTIQEQIQPIIKATLQLHSEVERSFRKTAQNFHYEFNVRHLTNVFQGLLQAKQEVILEPDNLVKLWVHEAERIYGDRLVNAANLATFKSLAAELCAKSFSRFNLKKYFGATPEPLIFAQFVGGLDDKLYDQFPNAEALSTRLAEALREYNDTNAVMDLVLFEDAMKHVCKISRIISADQGHALLVGVGGSGKQSLSRLSSFICQYNTMGIMIHSTYGMNDLKTDLQGYFMKCGVKDEGICFLFTEGQITNERFLVYINDLLSSGEIADLFQAEDVDGIVNNVRPAVKSEGMLDNKDNCWKFFINRIKKNLHMSLCFSPVGDAFRNRAKKFPAIINCTVIDWFHAWPEDALLSVAAKFLVDVEMASDEIRTGIEKFMPYSFKVVGKFSDMIMEQERRAVYTTPKSFLELILLFKQMQQKKEGEVINQKEKYETGVIKLQETGEVVAKLEDELKIFSVEVEAKKKSADEQAEIVGGEKSKVEAQNAVAEEEAAKCFKIKVEVEAKMKSVQADLDDAIPLVEKAMKALEGLDVKDFQILKQLNNPPQDVKDTFMCVLHLLCKVNPDVPVDAKGRLKTEKPWPTAQALMKEPKKFLESLNNYKEAIDSDKVPANNFKQIRDTLALESFTPENIATKSSAAAGVCDWIRNITSYYDVFVSVEPKKAAVAEAKATLAAANEKKEQVDALVADLNSKLQVLLDQFNIVMKEKNDAMAAAEKCERKMNLAQRLVGALGSELDRWQQSIIDCGETLKVIIGDVLLASAFVSYVGPFNKKFRDMIIYENFVEFFTQNNIPMSPNTNPMNILSDDATVAGWRTFGLPPDLVSTENGAILTNSARYSLIIDPQQQGIVWLRNTWEPHGLKITRLTNPKMPKDIEFSVENGNPVLIENMQNSIDAVIQPVYSRAIIKKGKNKYIKMGDKELSLNPNFNLFLHTKLSNPHYPPEIQAECTLINFTVTEAGLEDQLLSLVVEKERPDLAATKKTIVAQLNDYKIQGKELESGLLRQLAEAEGDILENIELIESLEYSKKLANEIVEKVVIALETENNINEASEIYRPAASRGALVFFLMSELSKIHSFYKFSLDSFVIVVKRAIDLVQAKAAAEKAAAKKAAAGGEEEGAEGEGEEEEGEAKPEEAEAPAEEEEQQLEMTPKTLEKRVVDLTDSITFQGFNYTRRGSFENHKLIISTMLTFRIMVRKGLLNPDEVSSLVRKEVATEVTHQPESLKFIPEVAWAAVKGLEQIKCFEHLLNQMDSEPHLWRKWYVDERPETCELPKSVKDISLFYRILLLRAMRPDRLTNALAEFVTLNMGIEYVEAEPFDIVATSLEMNNITPTFFVLFPGVDPTPEVELIAKMAGKTIAENSFINISMGQGQESFADNALRDAAKVGNWVMFQNVHLMQTWMKTFERNFEIAVDSDPHPDFRCFVSSEPPPMAMQEIIPESILQMSLKVANEAASDLKSNIRKALSKFDQPFYDKAKEHKEPEFKALLFGLCMFHSLILGRRKFGSQGWSRKYSFNDGDLRVCGDVLHNYLAGFEQVPYADLRYLYGEIFYGGHITDGWDRVTNNTYLLKLIVPEIMNKMQLTMAPGFRSPDPNKFQRADYVAFVDQLPPESPMMFGLHSNAEIGYLTTLGETLFATILQCSGGSSGGGGKGQDAAVKTMIDKFLDQLPAEFIMLELNVKAKAIGFSPMINVCLQECERMNTLIFTIRSSLEDLDAGLKGQLNITDDMEALAAKMFLNIQPDLWVKYAYFSLKDLLSWFDDVLMRIAQLEEYQDEMIPPKSLWISGMFNPMSFLTAIKQATARAKGLPLDGMDLKTSITNERDPAAIAAPAEDGAFIHGFTLQGASWENGRGGEQGSLGEMIPKELTPELPVMHVTAIERHLQVKLGYYTCPVYITTLRGGTYVFPALLRMESEDTDEKYWVLMGCALFMQPE